MRMKMQIWCKGSSKGQALQSSKISAITIEAAAG
jgi:hypothetical protein